MLPLGLFTWWSLYWECSFFPDPHIVFPFLSLSPAPFLSFPFPSFLSPSPLFLLSSLSLTSLPPSPFLYILSPCLPDTPSLYLSSSCSSDESPEKLYKNYWKEIYSLLPGFWWKVSIYLQKIWALLKGWLNFAKENLFSFERSLYSIALPPLTSKNISDIRISDTKNKVAFSYLEWNKFNHKIAVKRYVSSGQIKQTFSVVNHQVILRWSFFEFFILFLLLLFTSKHPISHIKLISVDENAQAVLDVWRLSTLLPLV